MKIGILGGGQLSKMLALSGIPLGFHFVFYFPKYDHSLDVLGKIINGAYDDFNLLNEFAQQVDVITYENENIPADSIEWLMNLKPTFPDCHAITVSQDRLTEKNFFLNLGIPTNRFIPTNNQSDVILAGKELGYPLIIKKRRFGYDGKGQYTLNHEKDIKTLPQQAFENSIAEEHIKFNREVSLIMTRSRQGSVYYDLCENTHYNGILSKTKNVKNDPTFNLAHDYINRIAEELNYFGTLTVEFFQVNNQLLANEMAPRVHNSGHWTIDACITSQFENHLRAIANLPLGSTESLSEVTMFNILSVMPDRAKLLEFNRICLHDYKKSAAIGRKLGHLTLIGNPSSNLVSEVEAIVQNNTEN